MSFCGLRVNILKREIVENFSTISIEDSSTIKDFFKSKYLFINDSDIEEAFLQVVA